MSREYTIHWNSQQRVGDAPNPADCSCSFASANHVSNTSSIRVVSVTITNLFPNFYGQGLKFYFLPNGVTDLAQLAYVSIPEGHYTTVTEVATALQTNAQYMFSTVMSVMEVATVKNVVGSKCFK